MSDRRFNIFCLNFKSMHTYIAKDKHKKKKNRKGKEEEKQIKGEKNSPHRIWDSSPRPSDYNYKSTKAIPLAKPSRS